jgi:hypothetical protein
MSPRPRTLELTGPFSSLWMTWIMALLADTAALLRARAILTQTPVTSALFELLPNQINLDFD